MLKLPSPGIEPPNLPSIHDQSSNHSSPPYTHPATYSPFKYMLVPEHRSTQSLNSSFYCRFQAFLLQPWWLATNLEYPTRALQARRSPHNGRHCNSAQCRNCPARGSSHRPWHRGASVHQSSLRVNSMAE